MSKGGHYRLYVDEVGTDDITHLDEDNHRFLSLTGVAIRLSDVRGSLDPNFLWIKTNVFDQDPDEPIIFHRSDIVKRKRRFGVLNDPAKRDLFDRSIKRALVATPYVVITALLDKRGMVNQPAWRNQHPYHYLMEILIEKYVQFLERADATGDVMPEGRKGKNDEALKVAFASVLTSGTYYVGAERMKRRLHSEHLKIRYKNNNISGLQLCDLIAHPSHIHIRNQMGHSVTLGPFCLKVRDILVADRYDRNPNTGTIKGYGYKWLP